MMTMPGKFAFVLDMPETRRKSSEKPPSSCKMPRVYCPKRHVQKAFNPGNKYNWGCA